MQKAKQAPRDLDHEQSMPSTRSGSSLLVISWRFGLVLLAALAGSALATLYAWSRHQRGSGEPDAWGDKRPARTAARCDSSEQRKIECSNDVKLRSEVAQTPIGRSVATTTDPPIAASPAKDQPLIRDGLSAVRNAGWRSSLNLIMIVLAALAVDRFAATKYVGGMVLGCAAAVLFALVETPWQPESSRWLDQWARVSSRSSVRRLALVTALLLSAVTFDLTVRNARGLWPAIPWIFSMTALVIAFPDRKGFGLDRTDRIIVAAFLVVGVLSRTLFLATWPPFIHGDEAQFGLIGLRFWNSLDAPFATNWLGHPGLSFLPFAVTVGLLGPNLLGLRLSAGVFGGLAMAALYLTGKKAFGRTIGVMAALILLLNVSNFHLSRMGMNNSQAVLVVIVGVGAFLSVLENPHRKRQWVILGLSLGLPVDTYFAALVWPLIAAVVTLPFLPRFIRQWRVIRPGVAAMIIALLIAAGPMLLFFAMHPADAVARGQGIWLFNNDAMQHEIQAYGVKPGDTTAVWQRQVARSLEALQMRGDTSLHYNSPRPLLDPVISVAFLLGLVVLLRRWRDPTSVLLFAWLLLNLIFGSVLVVDPPWAPRLVTLVPAASIIGGLGLVRVWSALVPAAVLRQRVVTMAAIACVVLGAVLGFSYYFGPYRMSAPNQEVTLLTRLAHDEQGQRVVYFVGVDLPPHFETIRFFAPDATVVSWRLGTPTPPRMTTALTAYAFAMPYAGGRAAQAEAQVRSQFPVGHEVILRNLAGSPLFRVWLTDTKAP